MAGTWHAGILRRTGRDAAGDRDLLGGGIMSKISEMLITPEIAEKYLGHNYEKQRLLQQPEVRKMARDMAEGRWNERIVEPIKITTDGKLLDGQHRLQAIIASGKSIWMYVQTDLLEGDFEYIDLGRKRIAADFVGGKNRTTLASIAKLAYCTLQGDAPLTSTLKGYLSVSPKESPSTTCIVNESKDPRVAKATTYARSIRTTMRCGSPTIYGYVAWLVEWLSECGVTSESKMGEYVQDICSVMPTQSTSVIIAYVKNKTLMGKSFTNEELLTVFLYGYDCFINNKPIKIYQPQNRTFERYNALISEARKQERL